MPLPKLKIVSIFLTVDGEVTLRGPWHWSVFVRTGGCNLRCWKSSGFCDAPHSLDMNYPHPEMSVDEVSREVMRRDIGRCTITGGEPMLQLEGITALAEQLNRSNWLTTLETSGSIKFTVQDISIFDSVIMDLKPPSTEMCKMNKLINLSQLRRNDFAKFVIQDRVDYDWAIQCLKSCPTKAQVAFGVKFNSINVSSLAEWLRKDERWDIMLNVQTHKFIWPGCEPDPHESLDAVDYDLLLEFER